VKLFPLVTFAAGAAAVAALSLAATVRNGPALVAEIGQAAAQARDAAGGEGIEISFVLANGWLTRHPALTGGEQLPDAVRANAATAIAGTPGVGGVAWRGSASRVRKQASAGPTESTSLHCQQDVEAILRVRTIRFEESSAQLDETSNKVLDEVAGALLPCLGGIIAITGHTDSNGDATANLALSRARAEAVRWALIGRNIPADGLRASGVGSKIPLKGLAPEDPANRRIEFSVVEKAPLAPTPIDTPGPG
jgi:OmpA-OmpF porin, OOP family